MLLGHNGKAATYYVNAGNPAPVSPFTTWVTAATNIQDAINIAAPGDIVLVTNGTYAYGGLAVVGTLTNRVALTNAITVQSVNGSVGDHDFRGGSQQRPERRPLRVVDQWLLARRLYFGFRCHAEQWRHLFALESGGGAWGAPPLQCAGCELCHRLEHGDSTMAGACTQGRVVSSLIVSKWGPETGRRIWKHSE